MHFLSCLFCSPRPLCNILWDIFCFHLSITFTILDTESSRYCGIGIVTSYSSRCTFKPLSVYLKQHGFSQSGTAYICTLETEHHTSRLEATSIQWHQLIRKFFFPHSAHCMNIVKYIQRLQNIDWCNYPAVWDSVSQTHSVCVCVCFFILFFITQPQFPTPMPSGNLHGL